MFRTTGRHGWNTRTDKKRCVMMSQLFSKWDKVYYKSVCCKDLYSFMFMQNSSRWVVCTQAQSSYRMNESIASKPQIYTRDPRPPIQSCVMASWDMGPVWSLWDFCWPHMQKQSKANVFTIFVRGATWYAWFFQAQTTPHAGNINTWRTTVILITEKTQRRPIWAAYR